VQDLQENGFFTWQSTKSGGYDVGATVRYNGINYINTVAGNTATPDATGSGWTQYADIGGLATQKFKVADATLADEALSKGQLLTEIKAVDGAGSGLDADLWTGTSRDTLVASLRANVNINGGGTITWDSNGYFNWTWSFMVMSNSRGAFFSTGGYFQIGNPPSGTIITGVGGAPDVTTTRAGIPISGWQALYYIMPINNGAASLSANFRIAYYTADIVIPDNWVLIASSNNDTNTLTIAGGKYTLHKGESIDTAKYSSAFVPNTDLVRGWDGALVWYSPTLLNSWVNYNATNYATCQYTKNPMTNEVTIRGFIKGGSNTANTTIFTLPVGFRPLLNTVQIHPVASGYTRTQVTPSGDVICYAGEVHDGNANTWMALNIKFIAGQ